MVDTNIIYKKIVPQNSMKSNESNPLPEAMASLAGSISGQAPLKIQIPGERTKSWLLTHAIPNKFVMAGIWG